jgi:putative endonuclease
MHYVYVMRSERDGKFYVGYTSDLRKRVKLHNEGRVLSTRTRRPFELVYYEACLARGDALKREKYLKTAYGKRYIKNRIREHLNGPK